AGRLAPPSEDRGVRRRDELAAREPDRYDRGVELPHVEARRPYRIRLGRRGGSRGFVVGGRRGGRRLLVRRLRGPGRGRAAGRHQSGKAEDEWDQEPLHHRPASIEVGRTAAGCWWCCGAPWGACGAWGATAFSASTSGAVDGSTAGSTVGSAVGVGS